MTSIAHPSLSHVLWLGGMSGVGKTTAARQIARKYDLRLGADRLRLNDFDSVHAVIDLSFCMATALLLGQERDKLGIAYPTPPCENDRLDVAAA